MRANVVSNVAVAEKSPTLRGLTAARTVATEPPSDAQPIGRLLTVSEVAGILRVHPNHIYELAARKALPAIRVGRLLRFHVDTLHQWIRSGGTQDPVGKYAIGLSGPRG